MSLTMDPVPPFSHLSSQQQHQHHHHHQLSPLHHARPSLPSHTSVPAAFNPQSRGTQRSDTSLSRSTTSSEHNREQLPLSPTHPHPLQTSWSSPKTAAARPHTYLQQPNTNSPSHPTPSSWVLPTPPQQSNSTAQTPQSATHPAAPPSTMASVHYAMPAQYGPLGIDESSLNTQAYHFDHSFRPAPQQAAPQTYDYSQAEQYGSAVMRTSSPMPMAPQYAEEYRMPAYSHAPGIAPRTMPSTSMGSVSSTFSSPNMYESGMYSHQPMAHPMAGQVPQGLAYAQPMYGAASVHSLPRSMSSISSASSIRASQKPKPQCWDHGCNGRRFSTFSNLLRHQREKSGTATKSYCPRCGAEFTRTTARNGHLAHDKCSKPRKDSTDSQ